MVESSLQILEVLLRSRTGYEDVINVNLYKFIPIQYFNRNAFSVNINSL